MRTGLKDIRVVAYQKDASTENNLLGIWAMLRSLIDDNKDTVSHDWHAEPWRFYSTLVSDCTFIEKRYPDQIKGKQVVTHLLSRRKFGNESFCAAYKDGYMILMRR